MFMNFNFMRIIVLETGLKAVHNKMLNKLIEIVN